MDIEATPLQRFATRAVIASLALVTVYALAKATWMVVSTLLVLYLAVIVAIGLRGSAEAIARRTPLGVGPALGLVVLLCAGVPVGAGFLLGPQLSEQVVEAEEQLPELQQRFDQWLSRARLRVQEVTGTDFGGGAGAATTASPEGQQAPPQTAPMPQGGQDAATGPSAPTQGAQAGPGATQQVVNKLQGGPASQIFGWIGGFVGGVSQALLGLLLVAVVGIYLAASPKLYEQGLILLVPIPHRPRVRAVLHELAEQLRAWIVAQIVAMAVVGIATTLGLLIIGVPMALLLGLLAGLLDFVPNFGPGIAAVPAILVAAGEGKVLPVVGLYVAVQILEGWLLRPLIEKKAVDTAPAMLLASQVVMGTIVGFMGLLMAPAVVVMITLFLRRFYIEDTLGDTLDDDAEEDHSKRSASTGSSREARQAG